MERHRLVFQKRGRPRSNASHEAILKATITQLRKVGYDRLAIDAVAAQAKVGKATVYRRWTTKESLVVDALAHLMHSIPTPDTGTLRGDLDVLFRETIAMYREPQSAGLLSALVAGMARSTKMARAVRSGFLAARRNAFRQTLERAARRGEMRKKLDMELALDFLSGPLFYRLVTRGKRPEGRLVRDCVDLVLHGMGGRST